MVLLFVLLFLVISYIVTGERICSRSVLRSNCSLLKEVIHSLFRVRATRREGRSETRGVRRTTRAWQPLGSLATRPTYVHTIPTAAAELYARLRKEILGAPSIAFENQGCDVVPTTFLESSFIKHWVTFPELNSVFIMLNLMPNKVFCCTFLKR